MPTSIDPNAPPAPESGTRSLKPPSPLDFIRANLHIFTRRGSVVASYRTKNGRRFGPYYRLAYVDNGRQRSRYLGRASRLVQRVRNLLGRLQKPRNDRREDARADRQRKANLLLAKRHWQQTLHAYGLYSRGWTVRGLRALGFPRLTNWQNRPPIDQPPTTVDKQASSPGARNLTPDARNRQNRLPLDQLTITTDQHPSNPGARSLQPGARHLIPDARNRQNRPPIDQPPTITDQHASGPGARSLAPGAQNRQNRSRSPPNHNPTLLQVVLP